MIQFSKRCTLGTRRDDQDGERVGGAPLLPQPRPAIVLLTRARTDQTTSESKEMMLIAKAAPFALISAASARRWGALECKRRPPAAHPCHPGQRKPRPGPGGNNPHARSGDHFQHATSAPTFRGIRAAIWMDAARTRRLRIRLRPGALTPKTCTGSVETEWEVVISAFASLFTSIEPRNGQLPPPQRRRRRAALRRVRGLPLGAYLRSTLDDVDKGG